MRKFFLISLLSIISIGANADTSSSATMFAQLFDKGVIEGWAEKNVLLSKTQTECFTNTTQYISENFMKELLLQKLTPDELKDLDNFFISSIGKKFFENFNLSDVNVEELMLSLPPNEMLELLKFSSSPTYKKIFYQEKFLAFLYEPENLKKAFSVVADKKKYCNIANNTNK